MQEDDLSDLLYQVRLFKRGELEIFEKVFHHHFIDINGKCPNILVEYGMPGYSTTSTRYLGPVYQIEIIGPGRWWPKDSIPMELNLIVNGQKLQSFLPTRRSNRNSKQGNVRVARL